MTANGKSFPVGERGNALIYVLIVIALFAGLTFVLARQRGDGEAGTVTTEAVNIDATHIMTAAAQLKLGVDQMMYSGSKIDDLGFCRPGEVCFSSALNIHQVFQPEGGGLTMPDIPARAVKQVDTNPLPGWYMGAFNNVEWTESAGFDVILVAHQISRPVCARIDELLTGVKPAVIPAVSVPLARALIDASKHTLTPNVDLDKTICPGCDGKTALCVSDSGATMFSYYSVIGQR
jgi:hypothetical protein